MAEIVNKFDIKLRPNKKNNIPRQFREEAREYLMRVINMAMSNQSLECFHVGHLENDLIRRYRGHIMSQTSEDLRELRGRILLMSRRQVEDLVESNLILSPVHTFTIPVHDKFAMQWRWHIDLQ